MDLFKSVEENGVNVITLPAMLDAKVVKDLEVAIKGWLLVPCAIHVLDFKEVQAFTSAVYRPFVLFNQALKNNQKALYCLNIPAKFGPQIKQDGLTSVFVGVSSIDEAQKKFKGQVEKVTVDVEFINPFIMAAKTVLETQANTQLKPGKPYLKKPDEQIQMEIAGVISLVSQDFKGSITICFPAVVFLQIYENMVGEKHAKITKEIEDAAGELLNIIFGQAKTVLNDQKGYALEKAIPTVLVGDRLTVHHQARSPALILPFESTAGSFHVEIVMEQG